MEYQNKFKTGWIGTGVMGASMYRHLLDAGFTGFVYNRTRSKALPLMERGAEWKDNPRLIAECSDIVFTMVGYPSDVKEVYFGENGLIKGVSKDKVLIDMTTTSPSLAKEIHDAARAKDASALDAPVSGGDVGAINATLSIMVGGDKALFDSMLPLFEIMGKKIVYQGSAGAGQHTKMANQIIIASTMIGVCESLLYGYKAGLDPEVMLESIGGGAAACWTLNNLAPRIIKGDFEPGFYIDHFIKDMGIALDEAKRMNLVLPGLQLVHQLYLSLKAKNYGLKGTHALIIALREMSGMKT
ncbi:MAG TPA: NAD(P)-dependent oxidoreductase [Bacteroidales bacterium]|nr:NAD(P)-dependent oxidoreductase [Bacteroidales bacterium]